MTQFFEYEMKLRWRPFGPGKIRAIFGHFDVILDIGSLQSPVYFHMYIDTDDDQILFDQGFLSAKTEDGAKAVVGVVSRAVSVCARLAVLESTYLAVNPATRSRLDEIRGQLRGLCMQYGMEVENVAPNTWKSSMLRINGRMPRGRKAQKEQAMVVARMLGAEPRNADEADAVCLCEWARRTRREDK